MTKQLSLLNLIQCLKLFETGWDPLREPAVWTLALGYPDIPLRKTRSISSICMVNLVLDWTVPSDTVNITSIPTPSYDAANAQDTYQLTRLLKANADMHEIKNALSRAKSTSSVAEMGRVQSEARIGKLAHLDAPTISYSVI